MKEEYIQSFLFSDMRVVLEQHRIEEIWYVLRSEVLQCSEDEWILRWMKAYEVWMGCKENAE
jgi:hypothetical protein